MKSEGRRQKAEILAVRDARRAARTFLLSAFCFLIFPTSAFCLLPSARISPPNPTIGTPITIEFPKPAIVSPSPDYEIVSQSGARVVVRTFQPKPFKVSGRMGDVAFRDLVVPVHSVLKPNDKMEPAPLIPPRPLPYPKLPFVLIGVAALLAAMSWTAVVLRANREHVVVTPPLSAEERYRLAVRNATTWAQLADAVRDYLAATTEIGRELTTTEVLECGGPAATFANVLRNGDLEKFSPWPPARDEFVAAKAAAGPPHSET